MFTSRVVISSLSFIFQQCKKTKFLKLDNNGNDNHLQTLGHSSRELFFMDGRVAIILLCNAQYDALGNFSNLFIYFYFLQQAHKNQLGQKNEKEWRIRKKDSIERSVSIIISLTYIQFSFFTSLFLLQLPLSLWFIIISI